MSRAADDPDAFVGRVLNGNYRLTGLIGTGGLGFVYRGHSIANDDAVAVKVLKNEFLREPQVVERFLGEAAVACQLDHPGIVRVLGGHVAEDETPYIVMELLIGHALSVEMRRGHLPATRAVFIIEHVLTALAFAHDHGVIHRDLKPDNVFVIPSQEGDDRIKLLDFGIARVVDSAGGATRKTQTGMLLGTAGYMSPEQVKNSKDTDQRSDLWAAGILFYEMLTGQRAFSADNEFVRATAVLHQDVAPIETVAPQFSHWSAFFRTALAREPAERFNSAGQMRLALSQVASGASLSSAQMSSTQLLPESAPIDGGPQPGRFAAESARAGTQPSAVFNPAKIVDDTRVSAQGQKAAAERVVDVQVVSAKPRGVPAPLVVALTVAALLLGYLLGATLSG